MPKLIKPEEKNRLKKTSELTVEDIIFGNASVNQETKDLYLPYKLLTDLSLFYLNNETKPDKFGFESIEELESIILAWRSLDKSKRDRYHNIYLNNQNEYLNILHFFKEIYQTSHT